MQCLINLETNDDNQKKLSKIKLAALSSELLPNGRPDFRNVRNYQTIIKLIEEHGREQIITILYILVKDLCESINLVRNMSDNQMIETAMYLLDECDNFRLQDYVMMFTLAKRGKLVKILDRMDMQIIGQMMTLYTDMRYEAGEKIQNESNNDYERQLKDMTMLPPGQKVNIENEWQKILEEEKARKEKELDDKRERRKADIEKRQNEYAKGQGVNMQKVVDEFYNKPKTEQNNASK